ncbi:hypothetical protein MBGDF03_00702 [Thermoplasmatales archaeon SCGC AB-540-F20]|nr:hypothetical protein MBGDF03_00702 [Thermoplasmatales archaeon SCGC AB-540-F20]
MNLLKNKSFLAASILLIVTFFIIVFILVDWIDTGFFVGPLRFSHWMVLIGTFFVAVYTPMFYFLKHRYIKRLKYLLNVHVFGFLISFLFISIHFAGQMGRPQQFYPEIGEGIALFIIMVLLVATGFIHRFQIFPKKTGKYYKPHFNRYYHVSITTAFYLVVTVHILVNIGVI